MKNQIDRIFAPLLTKYAQMGLVIGLLEQNQRTIVGSGKMSNAFPAPPNEESIFEIGSVTKVFTTTLFATLVRDHLVTLDTPVRDILTEYPHFPETITLLHLATHTSGLPRLPSNILWSVLRNPRNPYAHYTAEHLHAYLTHCKRRQRSPSSFPYIYSNLGMGLLGHVLARRLGNSYEQVIQERISTPLNLLNTGITLMPTQREHLVTPHTARGNATPLWDMGSLAGAGALRSNASDLLTFLEAHLDHHLTVLTPVLSLCHQIYVEKPNSSLAGIALGWHISILENTPYQAYWHNGSTLGCMAFVGFVKECNAGVVILSNYGVGRSGGTDITKHGLSLLRLICTQ